MLCDTLYRLTKFVVETFLPVIDIFLLSLEMKAYRVIRIQAEKYALKAREEGFYKLCCWFTVLRDLVDIGLFISDSIAQGKEDGKFSPGVTIKAHASISSSPDVNNTYIDLTSPTGFFGSPSASNQKQRISDPTKVEGKSPESIISKIVHHRFNTGDILSDDESINTDVGNVRSINASDITDVLSVNNNNNSNYKSNAPTLALPGHSINNEVMEFEEFEDSGHSPNDTNRIQSNDSKNKIKSKSNSKSKSKSKMKDESKSEEDEENGDKLGILFSSTNIIDPVSPLNRKTYAVITLPVKSLDVIVDMIDGIEVAIWDAAVEEFN